jgi:hypothetical protein
MNNAPLDKMVRQGKAFILDDDTIDEEGNWIQPDMSFHARIDKPGKQPLNVRKQANHKKNKTAKKSRKKNR